jgi:hypothetical protein
MYRQTDTDLTHHHTLAEFQKLVQTPYYKPANTHSYNTAELSQTAIYEAVIKIIEPNEKRD